MRFWIVVLCALGLSISHGAMGNAEAVYGYSFVPSARTLPPGGVAYSYSWLQSASIPQPDLASENQQHHALVATPFSWLEMGAVAHRTRYVDSGGVDWTGSLAGKLIFPKAFAYMPTLAVGAYDAVQKGRFLQNLYFVGGVDWQGSHGGLALDLGAIYHRQRNAYDSQSPSAVTSFFALELNYGKVSLGAQNFFQGTRYGVSPFVVIRPFASGPQWTPLELAAGGAWRAPNGDPGLSGWASVQVGLPGASVAESIDTSSSETFLWLDFNPAWDASVGEGEWPMRLAMDMELAHALYVPGFYMVHALALQTQTSENSRVVPRDLWDRSYLLYRPPYHGFRSGALHVAAPIVAGGLLNTDILGVQIYEHLILPGFVPAVWQSGWSWGHAQGWNSTLEMPLHPQGSQAFAYSQFYAEGGFYLGHHLGYRLAFRQGSARKHVKLAVGYDRSSQSIVAELVLKWDFSNPWALQGHGMAWRMAPHVDQRIEAPLYVYQVNAPIYVEGNSPRRLHGVPWTP